MLSGLLVCGCYSGVDAAASDGAEMADESSGGQSAPDDVPDDEDEPPEIGDCDPDAIASSTLRRLNRREYRNTVEDLLGVVPDVALPWDNLNSVGFDNDGGALTLDVAAASQYYDAAETIAAEVRGTPRSPLHECAEQDDLHACIDDGLHAWLRLAFRRPPSSIDALRRLLADQQTYDDIAETIIIFTLTSPQFLFHYQSTAARTEGEVDQYEVADRRAYLVWSSAPDPELLDAPLSDREVLEAQVDRMLADPRAKRFYADFPGLWLKLGLLQEKPDAATHGDLFEDMRRETTSFFEHIATTEAPIAALLDNHQSVLNGALADHYGIDKADDAWALVDLPARERSGLLTHGSVLVASSGSDFSDPIRRGSWVAQQIACQQPPPPPFEPPTLPEPEGGTTIREILEAHRSDPACAGCHALIDPYGLALESYDQLGLYRTAYDSGEPIDPSGKLVTGIEFDDTIDLARQLASQPDFATCVAQFLSTYTVGRVLTDDENCFVDLAVEQAGTDASIHDLLVAFVTSYLFAVTGGVE